MTIMFLLMLLREYRELHPAHTLQHVTVVEEAHNVMGNVKPTGPSEMAADTKGQAVQAFADLLTEVRAYVIADQSPEKLAPDAVRNTNLQIAHQLRDAKDRDFIGRALIMDKAQQDYLDKLQVGEAAVFMTGMEKATFMQAPPLSTFRNLLADKRQKIAPGHFRLVRNMAFLNRVFSAVMEMLGVCCDARGMFANERGVHHAPASFPTRSDLPRQDGCRPRLILFSPLILRVKRRRSDPECRLHLIQRDAVHGPPRASSHGYQFARSHLNHPGRTAPKESKGDDETAMDEYFYKKYGRAPYTEAAYPEAASGSGGSFSYAASPYAAREYSALRGIATLCRTPGWIVVGLAGLQALGGLLVMTDSFFAGAGLVTAAIIGGIGYIFLQVIAESISVLLDIEANTRRAANLLEQRLDR